MVLGTLGARDFSSAVSGFCRRSWLRPTAENSRRTREKPLVPRVGFGGRCHKIIDVCMDL